MGQKEQTKAVAQVTKGKVDPASFSWTQFNHMHGLEQPYSIAKETKKKVR